MKTKKLLHTNEIMWVFGQLFCSFGVACGTKAGFGLSMVAAPPYIISEKLLSYSPYFTQGICEYIWQGLLMMVLCLIVRRFKVNYLLSFVSAVVFGFALDGWFLLFGSNAVFSSISNRITAFIIGDAAVVFSIACFFRTDYPLLVYELVVTEIADRFHADIQQIKQINDIALLGIAVALSYCLHHSLVGIGLLGTVLVALTNSYFIAFFGKQIDRVCEYQAMFPRLHRILSVKTTPHN